MTELIEKMAATRQTMRTTLEKSAKTRAAKYDAAFATKDPGYQVGQLVYMKRSGPGSKLAPVWVGPFRLVQQITPVDWKMEGANGHAKLVHVNLLKRCEDPDSDLGVLRGRGRPRKEPVA